MLLLMPLFMWAHEPNCSICYRETAPLTGNEVLQCADLCLFLCLSAGMNMSPVSRLKKTWGKVKTAKFDILEVCVLCCLFCLQQWVGVIHWNEGICTGLNTSGIESWWMQCWHGTNHIKCSTLALVPVHAWCSNPWQYGRNLLPILVSSGRELLLLYHRFSEAQLFSLWVGVQMFTKLFRPHFRGVETFKILILNLHTVFTV